MFKQFRKVTTTGAAILLIASGAAAQETVSLASAANREVWRGETAGAQAGLSLDRGEVSAGDQRRDFIAGAPSWNSSTGRVYVVFSGPIRTGQQSLGNASVILTGAAAGDRFGEATAAGYVTAKEQSSPLPNRDLLVGAPGANGNAGVVYLYQRGLAFGARLGVADAILTITGAPAGARLGASLATGDLDGDGFREIIIGAPGIGAVYVVHGGPSTTGTINLSTPAPGVFFKIQGNPADGIGQVLAAGDFLGHAIAGNNTRYDLAIGAPLEASAAGGVYVILGHATNDFPATMDLSTSADVHYTGVDPGDQAGRTLQVTYLDKDRFADLLIGAPNGAGPSNTRPLGGEIYIIWGAAAVAGRPLINADITIFGATPGDHEGSALAFGDVNRDGFSDVVSLAPGASAAGDLHLFNARPRAAWTPLVDLATTFPDRRVIGDPSRGVVQSAVIVDMTGEGFDDIAAGYPADGEGSVQFNHSLAGVILEGPLSHVINPDVLTSFSAAADGSPMPTPQWQVSTDGVTWTNIPGATSTTFTFLAHASDNGKLFRAVFSSSVNSVVARPALLGVRSTAQPARPRDFDGDGATDVMIWRPSSGTFYSLTSSSAYSAVVGEQWGNASLGDQPFSADMDGDGMVDPVFYRSTTGVWAWLTSGTGYDRAQAMVRSWGDPSKGDVPLLADMDGDGKADIVVWRKSTGTWFVLKSSTGYNPSQGGVVQWGDPTQGDVPLTADFDGDGKADPVVWRASTGFWFALLSSSGYTTHFEKQWGNSALGDMPFLGDFDGDGRPDLAFWRSSNGVWAWLTSSTGYGQASAVAWGAPSLGDVPMLADFDGDGRSDLTVFRSSTGAWYPLLSSTGWRQFLSLGFGGSSDIPIVR